MGVTRRQFIHGAGITAGAAVATGTGAAQSGEKNRRGPPSIPFRRELNARNDMGIRDGDRVDAALQSALGDDGTLVRFPPGEYIVSRPIRLRGNNVGVESTTRDRGDVVFKPVRGRDPTMFQASGNAGFYIGHVTLDRRNEWNSSISLMDGNFEGSIHVKDIEIAGWAPESTDSIGKFNLSDPNSRALIDGVTQLGPIVYGVYPGGTTLAFFNGQGNKGDITYRNLDIRGSSESAIYSGKSYGAIHVEDSFFKNCAHSAVRVTGANSSIRNTTIVMDIDDLHPESRITDPDGVVLNRGIWVQSAGHQHTGPLIEGCDIIIKNAGDGIAGILNANDSGGSTIRNTRVRCDQNGITPIMAQGESSRKAGKPYNLVLDGVSVTGGGSGKPAIEITDRRGSEILNSCVQMPNADGVTFNYTGGGRIANTNINVSGRPVITRNASVSQSGISSGESCPSPDSSIPVGRPGSSPGGSSGYAIAQTVFMGAVISLGVVAIALGMVAVGIYMLYSLVSGW